jgi:hypothetical protein
MQFENMQTNRIENKEMIKNPEIIADESFCEVKRFIDELEKNYNNLIQGHDTLQGKGIYPFNEGDFDIRYRDRRPYGNENSNMFKVGDGKTNILFVNDKDSNDKHHYIITISKKGVLPYKFTYFSEKGYDGAYNKSTEPQGFKDTIMSLSNRGFLDLANINENEINPNNPEIVRQLFEFIKSATFDICGSYEKKFRFTLNKVETWIKSEKNPVPEKTVRNVINEKINKNNKVLGEEEINEFIERLKNKQMII